MIAVTGANGLLGSFIIRKLIEANEKFVAIKREGSDTSLLADVAEKITWRNADVTDPLRLQDAFQDCTQVIHAAAIVSFNPSLRKKVLNVNIQGTRNVVNVCLHMDIKRLVHISSVAALGRNKDQKVIDETNKWTESPVNSTYGESKYHAELEVFRGQEEGLSTVIVNPSIILAPADWDKSSAQVFKYAWDERPFYIAGSLNYVDVRDVAKAVYQLLNSPIESQRVILNAGSIPYEDFFGTLAKKFNKKPPSIKLSPRLLHVAALFEGIRAWVLNSEPLLTRETARLAGMHFLYNNEKVIKTLNFEFQSIDKTLQWCCDYYMTKFRTKN
jgi:nucleoside-diphosphate-sugar epimerase